jgi:glutamate/tyrosine decarboxylase-like PLP-dependent enzyme
MTGGTDSTTTALKTARAFKRVTKGASRQRFLPQSAHPCLDKAAHLMDVEAAALD